MASKVAGDLQGVSEPPKGARQATDQLTVVVTGAAAVDGPARDTYERYVADFATILLQEASREEIALRRDTSPEIQYTSGNFANAREYMRAAEMVAPRIPGWLLAIRVVTPIISIFAGLFIQFAWSEDAWPGWLFISGASLVALVVGLTALELYAARRR